ncbi:MAG: MBL fold metallo-hydrolase [Muribaculaceae bacterium]|nr:MBL fold metallo-hydrolase [Muribaculaceae bacterium]
MDMIKVIYVYHDCFIVTSKNAILVFDFWKDPLQKDVLPNPLVNVDRDIPVYVFVSHGHKDHYNPEIFMWSQVFSDIKYIISKDIRKRINHIISPDSPYKGVKVSEDKIITMTDDDSYEDNNIRVKSFPSTDIGNSYAVEIAGKNFFHSGDLNAWIWKDEST